MVFSSLHKALGFRERAVQLLIEELDTTGLEQGPSHLSSRKAGVIRPRVGFSRSHACTQRKAAEEAAAGFFEHLDHLSIWRAFFLCASPSSSVVRLRRFLFSSSRILTRRSSPHGAKSHGCPPPQTEQHAPHHLQLRFARAHLCACARILPSCATRRRRILFSSTRSLARSRSLSMISLRPPIRRRRFLFSRSRSKPRSVSSRSSSSRPASERAGASARPQAARPRGAACVACRREAAGPSEQPQGRERPCPPTRRASPQPCLHAPDGRGGSHLFEHGIKISIIEKARKRELGIFLFFRFPPSRGRRAQSHPQLLQVAPVPQRPRVVSVEAVDLVVEGGERLLLDGLHGDLVRAAAQLREGRPALAASARP